MKTTDVKPPMNKGEMPSNIPVKAPSSIARPGMSDHKKGK